MSCVSLCFAPLFPPSFDATLEVCRLRPILMPSFAFILGVVGLVISRGAAAEMRQTLGTAVFAGMLGVTIFGIFLTPVFYFAIQWITGRRGGSPSAPMESASAGGGSAGHETTQ